MAKKGKDYLKQSQKILNVVEKIKTNFEENTVYSLDLKIKNLFLENELTLDELNRIQVSNHLLLIRLVEISILIWGCRVDLNFINIEQMESLSYVFGVLSNEKDSNTELFSYDLALSKSFIDFILKEKEVDIKGREKPFYYRESDEFYIKRNLFNGNIKEWNTKNVRFFTGMFCYSRFRTHNLIFDLSNAVVMDEMFLRARFSKKFISKTTMPYLQSANCLFFNVENKINVTLDFSKSSSLWNLKLAFNSSNLNEESLKNINFNIKNISESDVFKMKEIFNTKLLTTNIESENIKQFVQKLNFKQVIDLFDKNGLFNSENNFIELNSIIRNNLAKTLKTNNLNESVHAKMLYFYLDLFNESMVTNNQDKYDEVKSVILANKNRLTLKQKEKVKTILVNESLCLDDDNQINSNLLI